MEVTIRINDAEVRAQEGESLLDAARRSGFSIPSLCHHEALEPIGACRLCLVEVKAGGKEELTTSCDFRVAAGIEVVTDSEQIRKQRAANIELLLARAPGSARLRQLAVEYGVAAPRFKPRVDSKLPDCILCELCVRVCAKLGHHALNTIGRGEHKRIGLPFNQPSDSCIGCGSCVSVCPTDCIFMKDSSTARTIWGQNFPFVFCKGCGAPVMTAAHRDFAIREKGLPEDYYDNCESCKQAATSKRFAAVAW
jgi:bidirectional [NiFe] hydrogenase diaphorase subunit